MKKIYIGIIFLLGSIFNAHSQFSGIYETYSIFSINGSANIYYDMLANTGNPDFNNANLGQFIIGTNTLVLKGAQNKVYKCAPDDITSGELWYRIYKVTSIPGPFIGGLFLNENVTNPGGTPGCGGVHQQWERTNSNINILSGLAPGTYKIQIYTTANYTPGPSTHFANAGGANYTATFTVCNSLVGSLWLGNTNVWANALNWCPTGIPGSTTNVIIPAGLLNYPVVNTVAGATAKDVTIETGASITVTNLSYFNLYGFVTASNNFDITTSTLTLAADGINLSGNSFKAKTIKNLRISGNSTLSGADTLKITDSLNFGYVNNKIFNTNGNLTLVSNALGTASIGDITNAGSNSGNSIVSEVNVERYIPAGRKWRFVAINTTGTAQTIQNSWMEAQTPGTIGVNDRGTWITQATGDPAAGFDATSITASMKWWNGTSYTNIGDPTTTNIKSQNGYMVFVRGDRNANGVNAVTSATTLRTKGTLAQNNVISNPISNTLFTYTAVANPYASAVNLSKVVFSDPAAVYIAIWDPNAPGSNGFGSFKYLSRAPATSNFTMSIGGGSYPVGLVVPIDTIESGQGIFVYASTLPRTITFTEQSKTARAREVFFTTGKMQQVAAVLSLKEGNTFVIVDGTKVDYLTNGTNVVGYDDALKLPNTSENISIKNNNTLLAIERRGLVQDNDTLHLNLTGLRIKEYQWNIDMSNLDEPGRVAFLWDRHLGTKKALLLNASNLINFSVSSTPASAAANRFYITYKQNAIPALNLNLSAALNQQGFINTNWVATNEAYVQSYLVEKGSNGTLFNSIATKMANNNNGQTEAYSFLDSINTKQNQYYRIKATLTNGNIVHSNIIKIEAEVNGSYIKVYPNPVQNKVVNLTFANKKAGNYKVQIIDKAGKLIHNKVININGAVQNVTLPFSKAIVTNIYTLIVSNYLNEILYSTKLLIK